MRPPEDGALEEIRFHWGLAYAIGADGGVFTARCRDGKGTLSDPLRADPVPRDLP